jgi:membrane protein implicated in regulation of membrane protease activity
MKQLTAAIFLLFLLIGIIVAPPIVYILGYFTNEFAIGYILTVLSLKQLVRLFKKLGKEIKKIIKNEKN